MNHRFSSPQEIELLLRSAPCPIQPSADLRSNILEAAVEQENDRSADKRLSKRILMLFGLLFVVATSAQYAYMRWSREVGQDVDRHVFSLSEKLAKERRLSAEASFAEAFLETRQDVADRLRSSK